jgi:hypothetical protein
VEAIMTKVLKSVFFALAFMSAGFAAAELDIAGWPVAAQQAAPPASAPAAPGIRDGVTPPAGAGARSAVRESAAALAPDVARVLEQVAKRVEALEARLIALVDEARARAIAYALWAAVGLFALMFVSSVLGGTVVALVLRRSRSA